MTWNEVRSHPKKQLKATLIFCLYNSGFKDTKHSYMHTWKRRYRTVGLMTKRDLSTFVHRGQDPTSWPANYNPASANYTSRSALQITVGVAPHGCWGQGGEAVSGGMFWPCMTLSYGLRDYSQFPCLWLERRNRLHLRLCKSLFESQKPCHTWNICEGEKVKKLRANRKSPLHDVQHQMCWI